ncbi:hypothetical protein [Phaeobacter sp. S60]|uniref:hypothetical protein n=1 Tax=Phaeobacter sp. S60 TaxID=1569353 RepID=UPI001A7E1CAC|nr:hypothetical protein [Phaeobacter sp. S60]
MGFSILPSAVICFVAYGAVGLTILPDLSHNEIDFIGFLKFSVAGVAASGTVLVPLAALVFGGGCFFGRRSFNRIRRQTGPGEGRDV